MSEPSDVRLRLVHPLLTAWRAPGVLQVGFDGRSFLLEGVPERLAEAIDLLAEPHTIAELARRLPDLDPRWLPWLCQHFRTVGLLTRHVPDAGRSLLVTGTGLLADSTLATLRAAGLRPRQAVGHADLLPADALVVVATGTAEPDRTLLNRLAGDGVEHLVVRVEPSRAVVGPLVCCAADPCVRCDDLARAQLDRAWPVLLAQLCTTRVQPDAVLCSWAAATAATVVRARLAGAPSELSGQSLELGLPGYRLRSRRWPVQPGCDHHGERWAPSGTLAG